MPEETESSKTTSSLMKTDDLAKVVVGAAAGYIASNFAKQAYDAAKELLQNRNS